MGLHASSPNSQTLSAFLPLPFTRRQPRSHPTRSSPPNPRTRRAGSSLSRLPPLLRNLQPSRRPSTCSLLPPLHQSTRSTPPPFNLQGRAAPDLQARVARPACVLVPSAVGRAGTRRPRPTGGLKPSADRTCRGAPPRSVGYRPGSCRFYHCIAREVASLICSIFYTCS